MLPRRTSSAGNLRGLGGQFPRRRLHFSVPGGFGGSFPRRTSSADNPRGLGGQFPRRRLQLFFLRRKRYHIPARKGVTERSRRVRQRNSALATKKLTQKVSFAVYFLKYVLLLNLLVIADQNLHQKSFSHQNPLYIPFLLLGICP